MSGHGGSFEATPDLRVFVCEHVSRRERPVLYVTHEADGDWQFLCGETHGDEERPVVVCVSHLLAADPALEELASLGCNHSAERSAPGAAWSIVDESEALIRANVEQHGWHVVMVAGDDEGPGFAYSIGMEETLGHPEVIIFGLSSPALMHRVVNEVGALVRAGTLPPPGRPVDGLLHEAACILAPVAREHYGTYFGHALWYYGGPSFRAVQVFWPGAVTGHFPWDPDAPADIVEAQPDLREGAA